MKKPTGKQVGSAALDALLLTLGVMAYALGVVCFCLLYTSRCV